MLRTLLFTILLSLATTACDDDPKSSNNVNNVNNINNLNNLNNFNNLTEFDAVPGTRCTLETRAGIVSVYAYEGGATEAAASVNDRPGVASAEVKLSDEACAYWEASSPGFCEPACELDQQCDATGTCRPMPQPVADLLLTLDTGEQTQTFEPQYAGTIYGTVTLPGRTFSATVTFSGLTVRLAPTTVPDSLADFTGVWLGTSSDPEGLDFAWTVPAAPEGSEVFTSIPINHHAGGPTHTECAVPSSAGAFSVAQEMLTPLAVITGLEFQGLQHVRFAAALTPKGCVEFRWQIYQQPTWAR